ncbi:hypothetical protein H8E77_19815 [bacterium]|nr:hypothetical protein [bacterium]
MRIPKKVIETSLKQKGFVQDNRDHRKFFLYYKSKKTGIFTYTSHGSKYKDIGNKLISIMKRQVRLEKNKEAEDLFRCPMSGDEYIQKLIERNIITS